MRDNVLKIIWVPKEYRKFSFKKLHKEMKDVLEDIKRQQEESKKTYADSMILQNRIANLSEEEARHNLSILIPYLEKMLEEGE